MNGISTLIEKARGSFLASFHQVRTPWEVTLWTRMWAWTWPCWHRDFGPPSLQNCEKLISVVYKPPNLWHFVIAAWTDEDRYAELWSLIDVHVLIPRTCEYVTLHDKGAFVHVIKVKDLEMGVECGLYRRAQYNHESLKAENFSSCGEREKQREGEREKERETETRGECDGRRVREVRQKKERFAA